MKRITAYIMFFIGVLHILEGGFLVVAPDTYAVRLGHDGRVLAHLVSVIHVMQGALCISCLFFKRGVWVVYNSIMLHAACSLVYAYDVFVDPNSSYSKSSFGFMMLCHIVAAMWCLVSLV
eukprot:TRINITY_DN6333_c0_g1_i1.p1 TRINITY_DN6333_c0_g1~~TRINITY_DN6333_c0_g1_i1.p1  ORF type:complete len:120 (+),score=22.52 TRINITY_DN6333_c0_g1_i1:521-880(+)